MDYRQVTFPTGLETSSGGTHLSPNSTEPISSNNHGLVSAQDVDLVELVAESGARMRKVQWADEESIIPAADTKDEPAAADEGVAPTYVDDKGMVRRLEDDDLNEQVPEIETASDAPKQSEKQYLKADIYDPIEYGDFRSYMKHKRAKLKIQEASLLEEEAALLKVGTGSEQESDAINDAEIESMGGKRSDALKGCCIYINGQTHPPYSELRRLLVLHGGDLMAYMDQKTPVTHIVASNLTPKKRIEFKDYKVVLPGWILESIELGRRADWRKWRCDAGTGSNGHTSESMIGKPVPGSSGNRTVSDQWRNLNHSARMPRPLPRLGEEDESPWGKPSNQTNLLQRFPMAKSANQGASAAKVKLLNPVEEQRSRTGTVSDDLGRSSEPSRPKPPSALKQMTEKAADTRAVRFSDSEPVPTTSKDLLCASSQSPQDVDSPAKPAKADDESDIAARGRESDNVQKTSGSESHMVQSADAPGPETPKRRAAPSNKSYYASCPSNTHAARLLASPSWRERNTATSEGFLAGYFAKSRLHHLSTWKTSLQDMVSSALREAGRPLGSSNLPKGVKRVIFHIDFDSFFVAVGLKNRPDLANKPVVVCHGSEHGLPAARPGDENRPADNQSSSTSEIASCSYKAREFGVRNGMSLGQAKRLCPEIETIPYDFEAYNSISLIFYSFLLEHSDALQAVSVDEALVDVSLLLEKMRNGEGTPGSVFDRYCGHLGSQGQAWTAEKQLAESFRDEIRERCKCEASIGIGSNILLARLATRKAKPAGSFHLTDDAKQPFLDQLNVDDLHGIGWSLRNRVREMFDTINIGEVLSRTSESKLSAEFGPKKGKTIWDKMHGLDADRIEGHKLRQSVGSHVNYGIRFVTQQEAETFVDGMCQEVSRRARAVKLRGKVVSVQVMIRAKDAPIEAPKFLGHGVCDTYHRSVQVSGPAGVSIDDTTRIKAAAWPLIRDLKADPKELRGIAISLNKLEPAEAYLLLPAEPIAGQSKLNFGKASPKAETEELSKEREANLSASSESDDVESIQLDEHGDTPPTLKKGRDAATPRKPIDVVRRAITPPSAARELPLPSPTQLMLPSRSQIDSEVLAALPTQYREQVNKKYGASALIGVHDSDLALQLDATPKSSLDESSTESQRQGSQIRTRILPRSTPTTPQKAKLAPTLAQAEALMLPSASQIDPSVLAELPASIRKEIEKQTRLDQAKGTDHATSSTASTPTKIRTKGEAATMSMFLRNDAKVGDKRSHMTRSLSESPSKKRMINKLLSKATGDKAGFHSAPDQPIVDRDSVLAIDPSKISSDELDALGIDAEVFRALPLDLQRETFRYHAEQRKSEKARFKAGKTNTFEELPAAEIRRRATLRAAQNELFGAKQLEQRMRGPDGVKRNAKAVAEEVSEEEAKRNAPLFLVARPRHRKPRRSSAILDPKPRDGSEAPSFRGFSSLSDVKKLIDEWVTTFATQGPRQGDVDRIASYLARLVRSSELCIEDADKVSAIIGWIRFRVDACGPGVAYDKWLEAVCSITDQVQGITRESFAGNELFIPAPSSHM